MFKKLTSLLNGRMVLGFLYTTRNANWDLCNNILLTQIDENVRNRIDNIFQHYSDESIISLQIQDSV